MQPISPGVLQVGPLIQSGRLEYTLGSYDELMTDFKRFYALIQRFDSNGSLVTQSVNRKRLGVIRKFADAFIRKWKLHDNEIVIALCQEINNLNARIELN